MRILNQSASEKNTICLFGHKLNGNIEVLYKLFEKNKKCEYYYLTMGYTYYKYLNNKGINCITTLSLFHCFKLAKTKFIITTHGPMLLSLLGLKKYTLIDVYHGIYHQYPPDDLIKMYKKIYSKVCVSSNAYRDYFVNEIGVPNEKIEVTGQGRVDPLLNNSLSNSDIRQYYNISNDIKKIVLIAPTWDIGKSNSSESQFSFFGKDITYFFNDLDKIGKQYNTLFIIRGHLNTYLSYKIKDKYLNIMSAPVDKFPLTYELLFISDVLLTDWSSIYADYLVLRRPIIFLDVPYPGGELCAPVKNLNRPGYMAKNYNEIIQLLQLSINNPNKYKTKFKNYIDKALYSFYGDTLDCNSTERYINVIDNL